MLVAVFVFGLIIGLASFYGMAFPKHLLNTVGQVASSRAGMLFSVGVRLVLGFLFTLAAPLTSFPNVFYVLGVITLAAAAALLFLGQARMTGLVEWFQGQPVGLTRVWLILGVVFGGFLIYAVAAPLGLT